VPVQEVIFSSCYCQYLLADAPHHFKQKGNAYATWKIIGYQMTNDGTSFRNHDLFHIYYLEEELLGWKNIEQNN
jgi:hypothetical protein